MITFLGDVALLNDGITSEYKPEGNYVVNYECVCSNAKLVPTPNKINLCSHNCNLDQIFGKKPLGACVANNHILDYGIQGYESTLNALHESGIATIGDKELFHGQICILAYTLFNGSWDGQSLVQFEKSKVETDVRNARIQGAHTIIVNMHWGVENYALPNEDQVSIGHWLIDNGVDIVIGHHSHCVQPIEIYNGHYIVYSLGNCIFPPFNVKSHYDENGIPQRQYRFKWRKWNNKGLALIYNEEDQCIERIDELYFHHNILRCKKQGVSISKYCSMNDKNRLFAKVQYMFRKYWLFIVGNSFVDGKIFDFSALIYELKR